VLSPRIIPCLLIHRSGLVKTVQFDKHKYVGDPINAVRIFNEKEVDELVVLDIDASVDGTEPDFEVIANLAAECRMPLCYGGGIKTVEQAKKIIELGVEKISLSSAAVENPQLVTEISQQIGSQSVVVTLDVRTDSKKDELTLWTHNGSQRIDSEPVEFAMKMEQLGAGEIVINNISNDGMMNGYDLELAERFREALNLPMTFLGGAGSTDDIKHLIERIGTAGAAAGSLFVFKGVYKAVLINYPSAATKVQITGQQI